MLTCLKYTWGRGETTKAESETLLLLAFTLTFAESLPLHTSVSLSVKHWHQYWVSFALNLTHRKCFLILLLFSWRVSTILSGTWDGKSRICEVQELQLWFRNVVFKFHPCLSYWPWTNLVSPVVLGDSGSYQLPGKPVTSWFPNTFKESECSLLWLSCFVVFMMLEDSKRKPNWAWIWVKL